MAVKPVPGNTHRFDPTILREYDIRGRVGATLSGADAAAIGRAFATVVARGVLEGERPRVCVGYDGRLSSPELERALIDGLASGGMTVARIGRGPTPMLYFAVHELDADAGVMVTGSHNPPDYNGFKFMLGKGAFYGEAIQELARIAEAGTLSGGSGRAEDRAVSEAYLARLAQGFDGERGLNVVWDAGNGATGEVLERLIARLPGTHRLLNGAIDGTFPAHHPDPSQPETLRELIATVAAEEAELGIAFDGDGDRIGVIDGKGRILWGDQLMLIYARDLLARQPGATIIADVKASQVLFDEVARLGGRPLMWRTGHSLIKEKMAATGAPLAGEMTGHIFFADRYYGFDDAIYAAVRLLGILGRSERSLSEINEALPEVFNTPELRFECADERKFAVVAEVREGLAAGGADFTDIDGVRVKTEDGWWLLRASNTQPALVARCESSNAEGLERLKERLIAELARCDVAPPDF
ncbi:MAG: phosphomannomutase/phosphoglucomutase [Alphaproteobacteria bacterium]